MKLAVFPLFSLMQIFTVFSRTDVSPSALRQNIGRAKVVAFSKDYLVKTGLEAGDLDKWEKELKRARELIKDSPLANAEVFFDSLNSAYVFVEGVVGEFHSRYAEKYVKEKGVYVPKFQPSEITLNSIKELKAKKTKAIQFRNAVLEVASYAFPREYVERLKAPDRWVDTYIVEEGNAKKKKSPMELWSVYKEFIDDYKNATGYEAFKKKFGNKYTLKEKDEKSFTLLLENIERVKYVLKASPISYFLQKNIAILTKAAQNIRQEFSSIITTLDIYKIAKDKSAQRTVLSAYAEAMEGVLNQLIRELGLLIKAAQEAKQ